MGRRKKEWIDINVRTPEKEGYYTVKLSDGTEDRKWYRIRPSKNSVGFLVEAIVTHWK